MHDTDSAFVPTVENADNNVAPVALDRARQVHERRPLGAAPGDNERLEFYPLDDDRPRRMPRSRRWRDVAKVGMVVLLGMLMIIIVRILITQ